MGKGPSRRDRRQHAHAPRAGVLAAAGARERDEVGAGRVVE